jgi:hypothetical protein
MSWILLSDSQRAPGNLGKDPEIRRTQDGHSIHTLLTWCRRAANFLQTVQLTLRGHQH